MRCDRQHPCKQCRERSCIAECVYRQSRSRTSPGRQTPEHLTSPGVRIPSTVSPNLASWKEPETLPLLASDDITTVVNLEDDCTGGLKSRTFGNGHWLFPASKMVVLKAFLERSKGFHEIRTKFSDLKHGTWQDLRSSLVRLPTTSLVSSFKQLLPDRATCEKHVRLYFQTYGRIYNFVDPPTLSSDLDKIYSQVDVHPILVLRVVLTCSLASMSSDDGMLASRKTARDVESYLMIYPHLQKPCIGVMQVLLLLCVIRSAVILQTDKVDDSHGFYGFVNQIALSMGLNKSPECYGKLSMYYKEVRVRLWACLQRLYLMHSIRSGTPYITQLKNCTCPLPQPGSWKTAYNSSARKDRSSIDTEPEVQEDIDARFGLIMAQICNITAFVYQKLGDSKSDTARNSDLELRKQLQSLTSDLTSHWPHQGVGEQDPIYLLQRSLMYTNIHTTMLLAGLGTLTTIRAVETMELMALWDDSITVLDNFRTDFQGNTVVGYMAVQLQSTEAIRAAFICCIIVGCLHRLDQGRNISLGPHHTATIFQSILSGYLSSLCRTWKPRISKGAPAAKTYLLLAICKAVTLNLHKERDDIEQHQQLFEAGCKAAHAAMVDVERAVAFRKGIDTPQSMDSQDQESASDFGAFLACKTPPGPDPFQLPSFDLLEASHMLQGESWLPLTSDADLLEATEFMMSPQDIDDFILQDADLGI